MKRVEVEMSTLQLVGVKERLRLIGVSGMTAFPCSGSHARKQSYRGVTNVAPTERIRLDIVVTDDMVDAVVRAVIAVVRRDDDADGTIWVVPIDESIRISNGATGSEAL